MATDRNSSRKQVLFGKYAAAPSPVSDGQFAPIQVDEYGNLKTSGGGGSSVAATYSTRIDDAPAGITYVGFAPVGSSESDPVWQIKKITESGTVTKVEFAEGETTFDKIWNNRASLTYI